MFVRIFGPFLLGLSLFVGADWISRTPEAQNMLWAAVGRRVPIRDWFMTNVVATRNTKAKEADLEQRGELVLIGSSQVAAGFDVRRLENKLGKSAVRMMSIGDMDSTRVLFALPYLCIGTNDAVVWYISTRDVMATPPLHLNWMRPFASWQGVAEILPLLEPKYAASSWRQLADLFFSASSELWRSRDYSRHVLLNAGGLNDPVRTTSAQDQLQQEMDKAASLRGGLASGERVALENSQFTALGRALHLLVQGGGQLLVLEGQLNPQADSPENRLLQTKLNVSLRKLSGEEGFIFLSIADQGVVHPSSEWKDLTHLNEDGQDRLTGFLLDYLRRTPTFMPDLKATDRQTGRAPSKGACGRSI